MWDTEVQKASIRRALEIAHEAGVTVAFDLADPFAVERYRDDFLELLEHEVDIVFANKTEAAILYGAGGSGGSGRDSGEGAAQGGAGSPDVTALARELGRHVSIAALKVGKDGSLVAVRGEGAREPLVTAVPGRPIRAIDSTGAGDMFAAGYLAGLARGQDPVHAARAAGWLAEEIIQKIGAQFSVEEITRLRGDLDAVMETVE